MKTILLPTDFSDNSRHAIHYILKLYKWEQASFHFLHAYADEVYEILKTDKGESLKKHQKKSQQNTDNALKALVDEISKEFQNPNHSYQYVSSFNFLVDALNDLAKEYDADLVVMGTQGETAGKQITFGSHTVQVFKYVHCPVLAIPENFEFQPPQKILFPTDYMMPYRRRELKLINDLAAEYNSEMHCLYISDFEDVSRRQLHHMGLIKESLHKAGVFFETTPVKNKAEAIMEYLSVHETQILVMVNSRHSFIEDMLSRSTVDEIGLHPKIPFLVMQNLPR